MSLHLEPGGGQDPPVAVAELGGVGEPSEQLDARLECPLLRRGRTIEDAAGHLYVLPPERLDDLASGHAERCDAMRIEHAAG